MFRDRTRQPLSRRRTRRIRRQLSAHLEALESRSLLAVATLVDHDFRSDDFSISGSFNYELRSPEDMNYIDQINNGSYSSTAGHVDWTSPALGTGFYEGVATGTGHDSVFYLGARRGCSNYTIRDEGRLDFTIDAGASDLVVATADATSTVYTSYQDLTGGRCPAPDPPWSRFFGGEASLYDGIFKSSDHTVAVNYQSGETRTMTVTAPAAAIQWATTAATDLTMTAGPYYPTPAAPAGWVEVDQTATVKPVTFIDPESGGVDLTAGVTGKIMKTATPLTPLANVRLFWATSNTDTTGAEIPFTSSGDPVGLYWNSLNVHSQIEQLPNPPNGATFVRVVIAGAAGTDATAANSVTFVPLGTFEVANVTAGQVVAGDVLDGSASSLMDAGDLSNPDVRLFAYNPVSQFGGALTVLNDQGAFIFDTSNAPGLQALAAGENANDTVEFLAIKNQTILDRATHTFTVVGVNDPPVAGLDVAATTNNLPLNLTLANLLSNDVELDHNDHVTFDGTSTTSQFGATIRAVHNPLTGSIDRLEYDPRGSVTLRGLSQGEQAVDSFTYTIRDDQGVESSGEVQVTVTGIAPQLAILPVANQFTRSGVAVGPISVGLFDPDGDAGNIVVTGQADNSTLVPTANIAITGTGDVRSMTITPAAGLTGKTVITLRATDGALANADLSFLLVVGAADDFDLDGITDAIENGAPNNGDMNGDGTPDMRQPNVVSAKSAHGPEYFALLALEPHAFEQVSVRDGTGDPAAPATMSLPLGVVHAELVLTGATTTTTRFITNETNPVVNRLLREVSGTSWANAMLYQGQGGELHNDHLQLTLTDGGWLDTTAANDRRVSLDAGFAHADLPWRNDNVLDVNNDRAISPVDALTVINELNGAGPRPLPQLPPGQMVIPGFLDSSGDNFLSAIDALLVINHLNDLVGEGEVTDSPPDDAPSPDGHAAAVDEVLTDWDDAEEDDPADVIAFTASPEVSPRNLFPLLASSAGPAIQAPSTSRSGSPNSETSLFDVDPTLDLLDPEL